MVEDDNAYYIILRRDIKERMTDDDLWTEDNMNSVIYTEYQKDFEDMRDKWCDDLNVEKEDIIDQLKNAGFEYSPEHNKFW